MAGKARTAQRVEDSHMAKVKMFAAYSVLRRLGEHVKEEGENDLALMANTAALALHSEIKELLDGQE